MSSSLSFVVEGPPQKRARISAERKLPEVFRIIANKDARGHTSPKRDIIPFVDIIDFLNKCEEYWKDKDFNNKSIRERWLQENAERETMGWEPIRRPKSEWLMYVPSDFLGVSQPLLPRIICDNPLYDSREIAYTNHQNGDLPKLVDARPFLEKMYEDAKEYEDWVLVELLAPAFEAEVDY
jgi:hypothetical protein